MVDECMNVRKNNWTDGAMNRMDACMNE